MGHSPISANCHHDHTRRLRGASCSRDGIQRLENSQRRRPMTKLLSSLAVVLTVAGLGAGDDATADLKKLTGTWEEVSHTADGKDKPADEVKGHTVVIGAHGKW